MVKKISSILVAVFLIYTGCLVTQACAAFEGVSVSTSGQWGNAQVGMASQVSSSLSANGRYATFDSDSAVLTSSDTNGKKDVFLRDRLLGTTTRISVASDGTQGNDDANATEGLTQHSISGNGRYVVFASAATNLISTHTDRFRFEDIFLHDMNTGTTTLVSRALGYPGTSALGDSTEPVISGDGNYVVFYSQAANLVPADTNGRGDIFIYDIRTNGISRVDLDSTGNQLQAGATQAVVNQDGSLVAFVSDDENVVPSDLNGKADVFVRDLKNHKTFRVSVSEQERELNGASGLPSMSENGCRVAFMSEATNVMDGSVASPGYVYVRDWCHPATILISQNTKGEPAKYISGYSTSFEAPVISGDGNRVAFVGVTSNLYNWGNEIPKFSSIYLRDIKARTTQLVNVASNGNASPAISPAINYDGSVITFSLFDPGADVSFDPSHLIFEIPTKTQQIISYQNLSPVASFTTSFSAENLTLHCDGSTSYDPDGGILSYRWDFGDGNFSDEQNPIHSYAILGSYIVKLTVTDNAYAQTTKEQNAIRASLNGGGIFCSPAVGSFEGFAQAWLSLLVFSGVVLGSVRLRFRK